MWDERNADDGAPPQSRRRRSNRVVVNLDDLHDGRCKASSWQGRRPAKPTYENHFGIGGFNRCVGSDGHANPTHKDEFGEVFILTERGCRVIRHEGKV